MQFLKHVARTYPDQPLHLVMDNYAAHKRVEIRDWLAANPRIHVHFTPTSASWLNLVEVWFGIIERQAIHRGTFGNVRELTTAIKKFIAGWNGRAHPFVWTKQQTKSSRKQTVNQLQTRTTRAETRRNPERSAERYAERDLDLGEFDNLIHRIC